jgi:hypothetical protein
MFTGITLSPKPQSVRDSFILRIEADSNDADYIYQTTVFTPFELHLYLPLINLLGDQVEDTDYNAEALGLTEDQADLLADIIPWGEHGVASSICVNSFEYIDADGVTFDVSYDLPTFMQAHPELFL